MKAFLTRLILPFRFVSRYRSRQALARMREWREKEAERSHQQALLKTFLTSLETIQETSAKESSANAQALMKVAESVAAQAQSFAEWMKCFQTTTAPTSSVVTEDDEYRSEQLALVKQGLPADVDALPEEFRLAWVLKNDPNWLGQNEPLQP